MRTPRALTAVALGVVVLSGASLPASGQTAEAPRRTAVLDGGYEGMSPATAPNAEGKVRLTLLEDSGRICYRVQVSGMTTRGVYVHRRANDVLMTRLYDEAPTDADTIRGCVTEVPAELLRAYRTHPGRFYVKAFSYDGMDEIGGTLKRPR